MTRKCACLAAILAAIMTGAVVCQGRVFFTWGAAAQSLRTLEALGGTLAYQASVTVNAGKGKLAVFAFRRPIGEVVADVTRAFAIPGFAYGGGSLGYGLVSTNGRALRFVAIRVEAQAQTIVFLVDQSDEERRRSAAPPVEALPAALPAYPGSEPVFYASDENAGMSLAISRARSEPAQVRRAMDSAMESGDWRPAHPATGAAMPGPGMRVYLKQQEICCVLVDASEKDGESRITVLHKQRGMK
ncbi:MAG: hypothetical protein AAB215_07450 [Planctomycetota bacterium]